MSVDLKTAGALTKRFNSAPGDAPVALHRGELYDFGDFRAAVAEYSDLLIRLDADRIAVLDDDAYPFTLALFSILCAGKKAVLPPNVNAAYLKEHPELFDAVIVSEDTFAREYAQSPMPFHENCGIVRLRTAHGNGDRIRLKVPEGGDLIEIYTSGSTGESKRVIKTPSQMCTEAGLLQALSEKDYAPFTRRDAPLYVAGSVSPRHLYGLTFRIFYALLSGQVMDSATVRYTEDLCARREPMVFITSPAFIRRIDREIAPPAIRVAVSAGGALDEEHARAFSDWSGAPIAEIYGSTETGIIASRRAGQAWTLFEGIELEKTQTGVRLHSPLIEGEMELDDTLEFHDERTFELKGRSDDIVKIEDKRVSLRAVELSLKEIQGITDASCVMLERGGRQMVGAVLVLSGRAEIARFATLRREVQGAWREELLKKLDPLAVPRRYVIVDAIPENHMGKRRRSDLLALFDHK